jgi:hypothetical protein
MKKVFKNIYLKHGHYFPADLWAFLIIILILLVGIIYISIT